MEPGDSIAAALASAPAGSTINLRGGTYRERFTVAKDGIILRPYKGEKVIIDTDGIVGAQAIHVKGNWCKVENLDIRGSEGSGIVATGKYATLSGLDVHDCYGGGILLQGDYSQAENCRVWNNSLMHEGGKGSIWASGLSAARYPKGCVLRRCEVWNTYGEGISTFEAEETVIEYCISHDNQINFYISDTKGTIVQSNKAYATPGNPIDKYTYQIGIFINDEKGFLNAEGGRERSSNNRVINNIVVGLARNFAMAPEPSVNLLVAHNTFVDATSSGMFFYAGSYDPFQFKSNLIKQDDGVVSNNIPGEAQLETVPSGNLCSRTPEAFGWAGIVGDPQLDEDYKPHALAIGAGVVTSVITDFGGNVRGIPPTIGAWE